MEISVIASTNLGHVASKESFDNFSGKTAGVCYMANSFNDLMQEKQEKTNKRIVQTKQGGHHSVYDHNYVSLYLENIPKILAMILNNEKMYTTSEKSARYTKMVLTESEQMLYDKWLYKFKELIANKYEKKYPKFFTESKILKLAQENARYLISVFTPTSMVYTTSYRQLNIIYSLLIKEMELFSDNPFFNKLKICIQNFCDVIIKSVPYLDDDLQKNEKYRSLSLFNHQNYKANKCYGDVYITTYKGSFAQFAQAQRHRTLNYNIKLN